MLRRPKKCKTNFEGFGVFSAVQEILCNQSKNSFSTKVVVYNCCILKNDKVGFLLGPSNMFTRFISRLAYCLIDPSDYTKSPFSIFKVVHG